MSTIIMPRQCSHLARLADGGGGRYTMNGILVEPGEGGSFRLVATDGKALGIVQGEGVAPEGLTLAALAGNVDEAGPPPGGSLIPVKDWAEGFKLGQKGQPIGMRLALNEFLMACGTRTLRGLNVEGRFPDYRAVLPRGVPLFRARLNAVRLIEVLRVAAAMQEKGKECVEVIFYGSNSPLGLMAQCQDGLFFDALIMPLT